MPKLQEGVRAAGGDGAGEGIEEIQPEPLDMAFPKGFKKQITYLALFPIIFPLWLTLPDTRCQKGKLVAEKTTLLKSLFFWFIYLGKGTGRGFGRG